MSFISRQVHAQAGLRGSLERLDTNQDGRIDPGEITPLARPYLERIARERRMQLDRPNDIATLQEAARIYYALRNGVAGGNVRPAGESSVQTFAPDTDQPLVPEFGLGDVKYPYIQADLNAAESIIRKCDRNGDGYVDRAEAANSKWTHRDPFEMDLNKDDRLSRQELTQRYARRRLLDNAATELVQKARRTGGDIRPSIRTQGNPVSSGSGRNSSRLVSDMMERFDMNRNERLEFLEAKKLGIPQGRVDLDNDGALSRDELFAFVKQLQDEAGDLTAGLPLWFVERDADRDGQVAMHEFTTEWTNENRQEFTSLDANSDGLLTPSELLQSHAIIGGNYRNSRAEVLPPGRTIISEIEVDDEFLIGDLNVELSITHSHADDLDAYLTGPEGQRIELFTEVGGSGDHFDHTVFDDQAREVISKARAPFKGTFLPEGLLNRQPGLSSFNGKSIKGVWQLVIRCTRSERFGMLHSWGLTVKPQD
ncbi:MAG: proprotein convertase P-domain-containing protein [Planctomycetota bacterium]|nr:proprotein convertase P-domain-containing protein [Planctomycetota bacterium]